MISESYEALSLKYVNRALLKMVGLGLVVLESWGDGPGDARVWKLPCNAENRTGTKDLMRGIVRMKRMVLK